jgi:DNA-3-methyladenine glycosylase I
MAIMNENSVFELMQDPGIIRNSAKIKAAIHNAKSYLNMLESGKTLGQFLWQFTDGKILINEYTSLRDLPSKTTLSDSISKELKGLGFTFMGSTVVYAHMQATGMVNDHLISCFRHRELINYSR